MATIHLAGSIVLFLFGGVITIVGLFGMYVYSVGWASLEGLNIAFILLVVGGCMILSGILVAMMSRSK